MTRLLRRFIGIVTVVEVVEDVEATTAADPPHRGEDSRADAGTEDRGKREGC